MDSAYCLENLTKNCRLSTLHRISCLHGLTISGQKYPTEILKQTKLSNQLNWIKYKYSIVITGEHIISSRFFPLSSFAPLVIKWYLLHFRSIKQANIRHKLNIEDYEYYFSYGQSWMFAWYSVDRHSFPGRLLYRYGIGAKETVKFN